MFLHLLKCCPPPDKCPATRVLASQLNPSSSVINHLLLGRKPRGGGSRLTSTSPSMLPGLTPTGSQRQVSPARQRCGSLPSSSGGSPGTSGGGAGSPWRAHVRVHRRNIARARAQLGFGDSEEREDEKGGGSSTEVERTTEEKQKDGSDSSVPPSPDPSVTGSVFEELPQAPDQRRELEVEEVVVQLDSLDLEDFPDNANPDTQPTPPESKPVLQIPLLPPPPSSNRHKEPDSSGSERSSASDRHSTPPHRSVSVSSSSSTPSLSPIPASTSLEPSGPSPPTSPSIPTPSTTSCLPSSPSAHGPPPSSAFYKTSSPSTPSLSSISSSSRSHMSSSPSTPAFPSASGVTPKQQVFSPFPSVKQPRKSAAARNLGLYGPTARTPTVHFPQLSRNLNRSGGAGTTRRR